MKRPDQFLMVGITLWCLWWRHPVASSPLFLSPSTLLFLLISSQHNIFFVFCFLGYVHIFFPPGVHSHFLCLLFSGARLRFFLFPGVCARSQEILFPGNILSASVHIIAFYSCSQQMVIASYVA